MSPMHSLLITKRLPFDWEPVLAVSIYGEVGTFTDVVFVLDDFIVVVKDEFHVHHAVALLVSRINGPVVARRDAGA